MSDDSNLIWDVICPTREVSAGADDISDPISDYFEAAKHAGEGWNTDLSSVVPAAEQTIEKRTAPESARDLSKAASRPGMLRFVQVGDLTVAFDHEGKEVRSYAS